MAKNGRELTPNQRREVLREQMLDAELRARYWKAEVETMEYSIRYEQLQPLYEEHLVRMREKEQQKVEQALANLKQAESLGAEVETVNQEEDGSGQES